MKILEEGIRLSVLQDKKKMLINMDMQKSPVKKRYIYRMRVWLSAAAAVTVSYIYMLVPGLMGTTINTFADNVGHVNSEVSILRTTKKSENKLESQAYNKYESSTIEDIGSEGYKNAIPSLEELVKQEPDVVNHQFFLALSYAYTNNTDKAIDLFLSIEDKIDPKKLPFYLCLGVAYYANEDYVEAKKMLLKHRSLSPDVHSDNITKLLKDIENKK